MAPAEIPFEYLYSALETTRGTLVTPPTRNWGVPGMITPKAEYNKPDDARGTLYKQYRQNIVREWTEWEAAGDVDLNTIHHICAGTIKGGVAASLVETGVQSWVFTPTGTSDDLKSYTLYWGDPNNQIWQSAYCMVDELTITGEGSGTSGVKFAVNGMGQKAVEVSAPSTIAVGTQLSLPPSRMDYYMDVAGGSYGTTSITSRILDVEITIPTEIKYKFGPVGAAGAGGNTFRRVGRDRRQASMKITMELLDTTQTDLFLAGTVMKHRALFSTEALIGATKRGEIKFDTYGYLEDLEWGDLEGVNRTVSFTVNSMYETSLTADFVLTVQNSTTTA